MKLYRARYSSTVYCFDNEPIDDMIYEFIPLEIPQPNQPENAVHAIAMDDIKQGDQVVVNPDTLQVMKANP